jgi:exopolysaccharide biosynthesis WecB/TagA/CpsF family protein
MNVAIVVDCLIKYGGAERVVDVLLKMYPESDLYALFITPEAFRKIRQLFPKVKIHTSKNQWLVKKEKISKYISIIKLWSNHYWKSLDLNEYDLIISSSHSFASKNVSNYDGIHISYVHTPPRFLYDEFSEIGWIKKKWIKKILSPVWNYLHNLDKQGSKKPLMVANSRTVKSRIEKYYNKKSLVIYPPVEVGFFKENKKKNYFLCLSRLVKQKGIDLAVRVCTKNNFPLIVIGNGPEIENLRNIAGNCVNFIEECSEDKKKKLLGEAKALIYPSMEEDFGIVPVEAMAMGVPVIGFASGGVKETVVDGVTGVLFYEYSIKALEGAIKKINEKKWNQRDCWKQANEFKEDVFFRKIKKVVDTELKNRNRKMKTVNCWGLLVTCLGLEKVSSLIVDWVTNGDKKNVYCCGLNDVVLSKENSKIAKILKKADLITPDGMPLVWRIKKETRNLFAKRVYGPDLMRLIFVKTIKIPNVNHFLLGGVDDDKLQILERQLKKNYRGVNIVGKYSPSFCKEFDKNEINKIVKMINESRANIIWLGVGGEKQIILAGELKKRLKSGVILTVGAAFDFLSGIKKQCPKIIRNFGGEWMFRWIFEPKRLTRRYLKIIKFYIKNIKSK